MTQHPPNESDIPINSRLEIFPAGIRTAPR